MKIFSFKKKLFGIIALCLAVAMMAVPVYADSSAGAESIDISDLIEDIIPDLSDIPVTTQAPDKVETKITISFRLGDSTLKINGTDVTVTTPFEENGTTLVPLRVITEAFGAAVDWSDPEQSVTLTYDDTVIKIWIDSTEALINGEKATLLLAPQLVNDTTMVPLRFITENFGAVVTYDEVTEAILVEKTVVEDAAVDDYSSILHNSDKEYVGDSYYGWRMKSSRDLNVARRTFDGRLTAFTDSNDSIMMISVEELGDSDKDDVFSAARGGLDGITITREDSTKDINGNDCLIVEGRTSEVRMLIKTIISGGRVFVVYGISPLDGDPSAFLGLAESFAAGARNFSDAYDLSEVESGKRVYENKNLNFKIELPADWRDLSDKDVENKFVFTDRSAANDGYSRVSISVQSKNNMKTAAEWAQRDYDINKAQFNPNYAEFSDGLQDGTFAGNPSKYYTYTVTYEKDDSKEQLRDIFFEKGEYVYNFSFLKSGGDANIDEIISSITVNEIDYGKVGSLLVRYTEDSYKKYNASDNLTFSAPSSWATISGADATLVTNGISAISVGTVSNYQASNMAETLYDTYFEQLKNCKKITAPIYKGIGSRSGHYFAFTYIDSQNLTYVREVFVFNDGSSCIIVDSDVPVELWGEKANEIFETAVTSVAFR